MMNIWNRVYALIVFSVIFAAGCESVALMPRADVDRRDYDPSGIRSDQDSRDRDLRTDEVVGTVQRVDEAARDIHLRTSEGRLVVFKYDPRTVVVHRDREFRVEDLRYGDLILVRAARNSRGEQFAEHIRMNDRPT
jgi:hypothetical protein